MDKKQIHRKTIIHLDMDAFYPSVEILDNPNLKGKPVIVGGNSKRGVVSSPSYEARKFGVHSAQPMAQAIKLCPHGIFLPVRMARYKELSDMIFAIFHRFTPLVEPLSIDEAFLDITGTERLLGEPVAVAKLIKQTVLDETGLTVSAGVAPSMFVAKIASDINKPDGLTVVTTDSLTAFLDPLPVSRMWGAGKVTQEKLERYNIKSFKDLRLFPVNTLERIFGKNGLRMHLLASGIDDREVTTGHDAKSIGHEETFLNDVTDVETAERDLLGLSIKTAERMRHMGLKAKVVTLKVKYNDFTLVTRAYTMDDYTDDGMILYATVRNLLNKTEVGTRPVRLLGISVSGLKPVDTGEQMLLFSHDEKKEKATNLNRAIDSVNERFGKKGILPGRLISD
jgi:DNA polymerase IV